jgi:hypothetical protein
MDYIGFLKSCIGVMIKSSTNKVIASKGKRFSKIWWFKILDETQKNNVIFSMPNIIISAWTLFLK